MRNYVCIFITSPTPFVDLARCSCYEATNFALLRMTQVWQRHVKPAWLMATAKLCKLALQTVLTLGCNTADNES
jgi:hypothetical protein